MSIYVLKKYVEDCLKKGINPTFEGLKIYNKKSILKYNIKRINN